MRFKSIPLDGCKIISHPRTDGRNGGGIALIYKEFLKVNEEREMQNNQMMECSRLKIELDSHDMVNLYAIYRNLALSVIGCCEELATILKRNIVVDREALLIMGDFNILIDNSSHADIQILSLTSWTASTFRIMLTSLHICTTHTRPVYSWQWQLKYQLSYQGSSIIWSLFHPHQPLHRQTDKAWNRNNL